ncbi:MAG: PqqD family protein [Acutalibacteraceae bacterium]
MEIKRKVVVRKVAGETMLIPVGNTAAEYNGIFTLSPSAATAFEAINNGGDEEDALRAILDNFDVDEDTARKDLDDFLVSLREFGII